MSIPSTAQKVTFQEEGDEALDAGCAGTEEHGAEHVVPMGTGHEPSQSLRLQQGIQDLLHVLVLMVAMLHDALKHSPGIEVERGRHCVAHQLSKHGMHRFRGENLDAPLQHEVAVHVARAGEHAATKLQHKSLHELQASTLETLLDDPAPVLVSHKVKKRSPESMDDPAAQLAGKEGLGHELRDHSGRMGIAGELGQARQDRSHHGRPQRWKSLSTGSFHLLTDPICTLSRLESLNQRTLLPFGLLLPRPAPDQKVR
mmetsp:Transcript_31263/g.73435  ORF Transcript_31263/g.73435 Transcript_31263/m.73435 type:complete len:257 (+) Transcript_31263:573-1343(+)